MAKRRKKRRNIKKKIANVFESALHSDKNFHAGIIKNLKEESNWLVYADWLEENGKPNIAKFIRICINRRGHPGYSRNAVDLKPGDWSIHSLKYNNIIYEIQLTVRNSFNKKYSHVLIIDDLSEQEYIQIVHNLIREGAIPTEQTIGFMERLK